MCKQFRDGPLSRDVAAQLASAFGQSVEFGLRCSLTSPRFSTAAGRGGPDLSLQPDGQLLVCHCGRLPATRTIAYFVAVKAINPPPISRGRK